MSHLTQLDDMFTAAGVMTSEKLENYRSLKYVYETKIHDYSFLAREVIAQLDGMFDERQF